MKSINNVLSTLNDAVLNTTFFVSLSLKKRRRMKNITHLRLCALIFSVGPVPPETDQ